MSAHFIPIGGPSHLGLVAVARPAEGLVVEDLLERGVEGEVRDGMVVMADVVYENGVYLDHSEAADRELVWACEFCRAYSRTKTIVEDHEAICPDNPET